MSAEEIEIEPIPGLPEYLPEGEHIVWQGRPQWKPLARQTFKIKWLFVYFGVFLVVRGVFAAYAGQWLDGALQLLVMTASFAACIGLCYLLAWVQARAAVYTITSSRIVMRIGAGLPITWNLPFSRMASADLTTRPDGDGDIVLRLTPPDQVAWLHLWPHARPGRGLRANPTLRAIAEPELVAARLEAAVRHWAADNEDEPLTIGAERTPAEATLQPIAVRESLAS